MVTPTRARASPSSSPTPAGGGERHRDRIHRFARPPARSLARSLFFSRARRAGARGEAVVWSSKCGPILSFRGAGGRGRRRDRGCSCCPCRHRRRRRRCCWAGGKEWTENRGEGRRRRPAARSMMVFGRPAQLAGCLLARPAVDVHSFTSTAAAAAGSRTKGGWMKWKRGKRDSERWTERGSEEERRASVRASAVHMKWANERPGRRAGLQLGRPQGGRDGR